MERSILTGNKKKRHSMGCLNVDTQDVKQDPRRKSITNFVTKTQVEELTMLNLLMYSSEDDISDEPQLIIHEASNLTKKRKKRHSAGCLYIDSQDVKQDPGRKSITNFLTKAQVKELTMLNLFMYNSDDDISDEPQLKKTASIHETSNLTENKKKRHSADCLHVDTQDVKQDPRRKSITNFLTKTEVEELTMLNLLMYSSEDDISEEPQLIIHEASNVKKNKKKRHSAGSLYVNTQDVKQDPGRKSITNFLTKTQVKELTMLNLLMNNSEDNISDDPQFDASLKKISSIYEASNLSKFFLYSFVCSTTPPLPKPTVTIFKVIVQSTRLFSSF